MKMAKDKAYKPWIISWIKKLMGSDTVFYIYDSAMANWTNWTIKKLLKYENKDWEESIRIRWTYGKKRPWTQEDLENMQFNCKLGKDNGGYISEKEFDEKFKEFEKFWEKDETLYIVDPGVDGFRQLLKYERIWWEEEITIYDQSWREKVCNLEKKLKELERMLASEIFWDRWDCFEVSKDSAKETLEKWRSEK